MLKSLLHIEDFDLKDKKVFIRADLNVPVVDGKVKNSYRIMNALATIRYALDQDAKVILASHLGRPNGVEPSLSLSPVAQTLSEILDLDVFFIEELVSDVPSVISPSLKKNQLIMLENLRFYPGEIENNEQLAKELAKDIDIYINDAFGVCHREHMSLHALPKNVKQKGIGFLIQKEMEQLDQIKNNPLRPFVVVLGGSKVRDKFDTILSLIDYVDGLVIGGAMAYVFLKVKGYRTGDTFVDTPSISLAKELIERIQERKKKLYLPVDHVVVPEIQKTNYAKVTADANIPDNWKAVDIGPQTISFFSKAFQGAQTIFWNGPMGIFEIEPYSKGTVAIADEIAKRREAFRVVGGGDSVRAVFQCGAEKEFNHVSTGGGASLVYIQGKTLPGIFNVQTVVKK